jgi:hypothetical protein
VTDAPAPSRGDRATAGSPANWLPGPERPETGGGIWLGLFIALLLLVRTGTPPPVVVLCLIVVGAVLLGSLRWRVGPLAIATLLVVGMVLRIDAIGTSGSDVLTVTRAAIDTLLAGGNPYGHGYVQSTPRGAPFAYGPLALLWYLPVRGDPAWLELLVSAFLLVVLAARGRVVGLAVYATLPPLVVTAYDGSNDTSAGLLLLVALLLMSRLPRLGAVALAVAVAFKPYALAWLAPLVAWGGLGTLVPFVAATALAWGPAILAWGAADMTWSLLRADSIHQTPYYALAYSLAERIKATPEAFAVLRFAAGALVAVAGFGLVRSPRSMIVSGIAIFLATLYLGWWSTFAYVAAIAPVVCWHLDDWLSLPRVVWPGDPVGLISDAVDQRWPASGRAPGLAGSTTAGGTDEAPGTMAA